MRLFEDKKGSCYVFTWLNLSSGESVWLSWKRVEPTWSGWQCQFINILYLPYHFFTTWLLVTQIVRSTLLEMNCVNLVGSCDLHPLHIYSHLLTSGEWRPDFCSVGSSTNWDKWSVLKLTRLAGRQFARCTHALRTKKVYVVLLFCKPTSSESDLYVVFLSHDLISRGSDRLCLLTIRFGSGVLDMSDIILSNKDKK